MNNLLKLTKNYTIMPEYTISDEILEQKAKEYAENKIKSKGCQVDWLAEKLIPYYIEEFSAGYRQALEDVSYGWVKQE